MANASAIQLKLDEALVAEILELRKALEEICQDDDGAYTEAFDYLRARGLIVEAPPTERFIEHWGEGATMYVWRWRAAPPEQQNQQPGSGPREGKP